MGRRYTFYRYVGRSSREDFVSHNRLLTRGHDLAVLSIMPFSMLETCHLIVNHATAVRYTAPSSLHPHYRQVMQTLIVLVDQSFTALHTLHVCYLANRCSARLYTHH